MEQKINIAELLKDCPQGMELDCTMFEGIEFDSIVNNDCFPILCRMKNSNDKYNFYSFTKYGYWNDDYRAKCVIFPKGKTTWEGFQRPFVDGDILATDLGSVFFLNTRLNSDEHYGCYVGIGGDGSFHICAPFAYKECCGLATKKEKKKLFDAIKANGYKWNAETKTLEELIEPKFKVGDRIRHKYVRLANRTIISYDENIGYFTTMHDWVRIEYQNDWELVPNKFDITALKPFDKVLVRDNNAQKWVISFFSHCNGLETHKHSCINGSGYAQCIPYNEDTKHLIGTPNDCDEYYKTWE